MTLSYLGRCVQTSFGQGEMLDSETVLSMAAELARRQEPVIVAVGRLDMSDPRDRALLADLARTRRQQLYGVSLTCEVGEEVGRDDAVLLAAAGVSRAQLTTTEETRIGTPEERTLSRLRSVKHLYEVSISVNWSLDGSLSQPPRAADLLAMCRLCAAAEHLPPPREATLNSGSCGETGHTDAMAVGQYSDNGDDSVHELESDPETGLRRAVRQWRTGHRPWLVSYARGPRFVRVYDRRQGREKGVFIVLRGRQADLFHELEGEHKSVDQVGHGLGTCDLRAVHGLMDRLVDHGLAYRSANNMYQVLIPRRGFHERWVGGSYFGQ